MSRLRCTVKVIFGTDIRRFPFHVCSQSTFSALWDTMCATFELLTSRHCVKYIDEDGDMCTLTQSTFPDAFMVPLAQSYESSEFCEMNDNFGASTWTIHLYVYEIFHVSTVKRVRRSKKVLNNIPIQPIASDTTPVALESPCQIDSQMESLLGDFGLDVSLANRISTISASWSGLMQKLQQIGEADSYTLMSRCLLVLCLAVSQVWKLVYCGAYISLDSDELDVPKQ